MADELGAKKGAQQEVANLKQKLTDERNAREKLATRLHNELRDLAAKKEAEAAESDDESEALTETETEGEDDDDEESDAQSETSSKASVGRAVGRGVVKYKVKEQFCGFEFFGDDLAQVCIRHMIRGQRCVFAVLGATLSALPLRAARPRVLFCLPHTLHH